MGKKTNEQGIPDVPAIQALYLAAANRTLALMLDLDGATVHRTPAKHNPVEPDLEYDAALRTLAENGCPVSINTGRPAIFVNNLFPLLVTQPDLPLWIATETGAKIFGPNNTEMFSKNIPAIENLRSHFADQARPYAGAIIEDHKMCAITISLKHCDDNQRHDAYAHMRSVANQAAEQNPDINIIAVWKTNDVYIEVVPNGIDKGTAARHIMRDVAFDGKTMFCFGDSTADEAMMAVVCDHGGYAIGIGDGVAAHMLDVKLQHLNQSQHIIQTAAKLASGEIKLNDAMPQLQQLRNNM